MRRELRRYSSGLLLATACACAGPRPEGASPSGPSVPVVFLCPDGSRVLADFQGGQDSLSLEVSGRAVRLTRTLSASGARYEGDGTVFWNKGDDAMILTAGGSVTCRAEPAGVP